jgi:predicted Zn-dependent protease
MPNLRRLIERGVMGNLGTLSPCISPILWTSIATGKTADRHGIAGFLEPDPITGGIRPTASTSRRAKALWNICSQSGLRSLVLNWYACHPAEPIAGVMVSREFALVRGPHGAERPVPADSVYPAALAETLAGLRLHPAEMTGDDLLPFIPGLAGIDQQRDRRPEKLATTLAETISVHAATTWLMENQDWDFLAVYFDTIDHLGHFFMDMCPPRMEHVSEGDFEIYREVMNGAYCFHDMMLGRLVQLAGPDAAILVVSDHGFHSGDQRPLAPASFGPETALEWHRDMGVLCMAGAGIRHDELVYGATLLDIAPTVLTLLGLPVAADMPGRVVAEAFERPVPAARIPSWEDVPGDAGMHPPEQRADPWDASEAVQQLRDLGYVDALAESEAETVQLVRLHQEFNLARVHVSAGRGADALPLMENVVRVKPGELTFQLLLAQCYFMTGRAEDCRRVAEAVLRQDPDRPMATLLKASLAMAEGRLQEGLAGLLAAERSARLAPRLRVAIGNVYLRLKQWQGAERAFRAALAVDADLAAAHAGLASALMGEGDDYAALDAAARAVGLRFDLPGAHFTLGVALARTGERERAIQAFQTCLAVEPLATGARQWLDHLCGHTNDRHDSVPAGS